MLDIINRGKEQIKELINNQLVKAIKEGRKLCVEEMLEYLKENNNGAYDEPEIKAFINDFTKEYFK